MLSVVVSLLAAPAHELVGAELQWRAWKAEHGKAYPTAAAEAKAFATYQANDKLITDHNSKGTESYELGHNEFSDLTSEEFFKNRLGYDASKPRPKPSGTHTYTAADLAALANTTVDWVAKGAVTPVKNQGQCGSYAPARHPARLGGTPRLPGPFVPSLSV